MTNRAKALFSIVVIVRSTLLVALYRSFSPVEPFVIGFRHSSKRIHVHTARAGAFLGIGQKIMPLLLGTSILRDRHAFQLPAPLAASSAP